jgi:hypothetical protein
MHFVVGKNGIDTRKGVRGVVIHTPKLPDNVDAHFYHNPKGDANFAARFVAALAGMSSYLAQAAPSGTTKFAIAKCINNQLTVPWSNCYEYNHS